MRIAVQMDDIECLNPASDSTLALIAEAQARAFDIAFYHPRSLCRHSSGIVTADFYSPVPGDKSHEPWKRGPYTGRRDLREYDVILIRQDPPYDMAYITACHCLEGLPDTVRLINHPRGIRDAPEKILVMDFSDLTPASIMTANPAAMAAFARTNASACGRIVIKPLYGHAGRYIEIVENSDIENIRAAAGRIAAASGISAVICQTYLPSIQNDGDKRIILIDGNPVGAFMRRPAPGSHIANLAAGGSAHPAALTDRDHLICQRLKPALRARGLFFAGIDVIGGLLTEINVTSPTGIRAINAFEGIKAESLFWDEVRLTGSDPHSGSLFSRIIL